jgi:hypothetical protein
VTNTWAMISQRGLKKTGYPNETLPLPGARCPVGTFAIGVAGWTIYGRIFERQIDTMLARFRRLSIGEKAKIIKMKKIMFVLFLLTVLLSGCAKADVASHNLSTAADNFEINRRIVFYNGITGDYILVIEGLCSIGNYDTAGEVSITCRTGENEFKKHYLGLSDNVTYFAEQIAPAKTDPFFYRVIFRPSTIVPDIELQVP